MPNQIIFTANITPVNTPMEVCVNGVTFTTLTFTTAGSVQQGILTGVTAGSYAAGQLGLGAVGYPATRLYNTTAVAVINAAAVAKLHFMGDSITIGAVATSWVIGLQSILSGTSFPVAGYNNQAISGQSSDQQLAIEPTGIIAAKGTGGGTYGQDILSLLIGVNDLRIGDAGTPHAGQYRTKDQIAHDILEIGRQARLNGFKPVLLTVFPDRRLNVTNPTEDARMLQLRLDVNALLLANYTKYGFVGLVNLSTNANVGGPNTPIANSGTYYLTDLIHPSNTGETYIAQQVAPVIQTVAATALAAFTDPGQYALAPVISSFAPATATVGSSVTITGTALSGVTVLTVGGVSATASLSGNTATAVTFIVPAGASTGPLALTTPGGTATSATSLTIAAAATGRIAAAFKTGVSVTVSGNTVTKTGGAADTFDAGTTGTIALGSSTATVRGYLDFVANKNGGSDLIGFHAGTDANATHVQLISAGAVAIQASSSASENGLRWFINGAAPTAFIPYVEGDRIKLEIQQSNIVIYQNGTQIGTAAYALPVNSYIDMSITKLNSSITDIYIMADNPIAI